MSRRSRKSKRKLNSLFMVMLLTAMILMSSTYAWFSANKTVTLEGINAKVVAAEGLQISLDGETWGSKFTINEANLEAAEGNNYLWPEALIPVSTVGETTSGNLNMYYGDVSADGTTLTNAGEAGSDKYIVFDLYFKNSSSSETGDVLQLNEGTKVAIASDGKEGTGLENSVRTAVVLWSSTEELTAAATDVRGLAYGTPKVSIWEPNYNKHIAEIVKNDTRISATNSVFTTIGLKGSGDGTVNNINVASVPENSEVLGAQTTLQTDAELGAATNLTNLGGDALTLSPNAIMKARIYIWLEGQDPDCIDTASTGKSLDFTIGFTKPGIDDEETPSGGGSDDDTEEGDEGEPTT